MEFWRFQQVYLKINKNSLDIFSQNISLQQNPSFNVFLTPRTPSTITAWLLPRPPARFAVEWIHLSSRIGGQGRTPRGVAAGGPRWRIAGGPKG